MHDAVGNRTSLAYPDGKIVSYAYDQLNRLAQGLDWLARPTTYAYDFASNLTKVLYPSGANVAFSYDAANRLTNVSNSAPGLPTVSISYTLDPVGNRTALNVNGVLTTFAYDSLNQLLAAQLGTLKTTWTYDQVGNRLQQVGPTGTTTYTYDAADRLLSAGAVSFTYDRNGNQIRKSTNKGSLAYSYDAANRLIAAVGLGANNAFAYDGDGNRTSQTTSTGMYGYVNDVATALPVVLSEQGPDGNIAYAYGLGLIEEAGPAFNYFYHYDGLGSVIALTDAAGKPQAGYAYDAWGNALLTVTDNVGTKNKFRFTGETLDPGTGLYYLRARYYDPSVGRFLARDNSDALANDPLTFYAYTYSRNNPIRFVDHSGLTPAESTGLNLSSFVQIGNLRIPRAKLNDPTFVDNLRKLLQADSRAFTELDQALKDIQIDTAISAAGAIILLPAEYIGAILKIAPMAIDIIDFADTTGTFIDALNVSGILRRHR